jgi:LAO/AO transport system kinase
MVEDNVDYYLDGVRIKDRRIIARTITLIESSLPSHQELAHTIINRLISLSGNAVRLGITGVPGVGKSTFIESLGMHLLAEGKRVAVLAVDPSSTRTGGSILADKTRMEKLSIEKNAFIRPSPSGGTLGGVAKKTREAMIVCEAAGFDVVIVETVGVGQSETTVASMVDFFLVLMLAGAGDQLQGIKKGVLEIADAIVINKADGDNINKANMAKKEYENALHLLRPVSATWSPPVLTCSALEKISIEKIWHCVLQHRETFIKTGELKLKRSEQAVSWMWSLLEEGLKDRFYKNIKVKQMLPQMIKKVEKGVLSPTRAADELLLYDKT